MRELQNWMYGAITAPEAPDRDSVLERLTESERIELYRGMYDLRMVEALGNDYPVIAAFLGDHNFEHLVRAYLAVHPSASYTLNRLGDLLPSYIAGRVDASGPAEGADGIVSPFLHDLARLELAITHVFDEAETPLLPAERIAAITPDTRLPLIAAIRFLELEYPVDPFFQAHRDGAPLVAPPPQKSWMVIYRRAYSVMRMSLEERPFRFLAALAGGATLGEACDAVEPAQDELFAWFRDWSAAGLFGDIS